MAIINTNRGSKFVLVLVLTVMITTAMLTTGAEAVKFGCILKCNLWKCLYPGSKSKAQCIVDCMDGCHHKNKAVMLH
ncbi:hypothetical protein ERO13_D08G264600v2 [Gossypium hirsutum]|uniref:Plant thionin family protein n=3 Tax=Gossypium TaxID=3633 RepID=A0A5J5QLY7_GOSBA|nr:hypothetical protein ES319_D08G291600v1 [Gossypium barbadense]KAG4136189.1 hypothetical protein ERO13_D08G264600v2 [Gossypium hirsutum]TYG59455.1 hypothetical protein ES288_D08G303800v1 [Gossypium darwinii]TYH60565.1 hypothetical protein ES332_D08G302900v1 [Gossypium tomentosum]